MWNGSWSQSVKAPLCYSFLLILGPFHVIHRLQCTCSGVVLSIGCRSISFLHFCLTLLSCNAVWNSMDVKHTHSSLVLLKLSCSIKKKKRINYALKDGFLNTLSPRSLHLGCGAQTFPEMGCSVPGECPALGSPDHSSQSFLMSLLPALGHRNSIH